jgi:polyferredoxin
MTLMEALPQECMAGTFYSHGGVALAVTVLGLLCAAASLALGFHWFREETRFRRNRRDVPDRHTARAWLLGLWVLAPPAWLYIEAIFLYRRFGKAACFSSFEHAQELVLHGWIVLVAVLALLCFGRDLFSRVE